MQKNYFFEEKLRSLNVEIVYFKWISLQKIKLLKRCQSDVLEILWKIIFLLRLNKLKEKIGLLNRLFVKLYNFQKKIKMMQIEFYI